MSKLFEEAQAYSPKQTKNIADLDEVSVELDVIDDEFEAPDEEGNTKVIKQKVVEIDGVRYRVPSSVLMQLKSLLEDNPGLKKFRVKKSGQGLNTNYLVIPITKV